MGGLPDKVANFLCTTALLKNPDNECDNMIWTFGSTASVITDKSKGMDRTNRFMSGQEVMIQTLVDRTKPFSWNLDNVAKAARNRNEGTNINSIASAIESWIRSTSNVSEQEYRKEWISRYPVMLIVSDGDMNNSHGAARSVMQFQQSMRQIAGWEGVVVIFDVCSTSTRETSKFDGVENVIHFLGWNLGAVNSIFSKIHDLDVIDIYTPLKSLWLSNRYELVRKNVI
jgi:hypothetical protein